MFPGSGFVLFHLCISIAPAFSFRPDSTGPAPGDPVWIVPKSIHERRGGDEQSYVRSICLSARGMISPPREFDSGFSENPFFLPVSHMEVLQ